MNVASAMSFVWDTKPDFPSEGWDEKDKADYERNKQFEKLTTETSAMREMEKMQLAFHKA